MVHEGASGQQDLTADDEGRDRFDSLVEVVVDQDPVHPVVGQECLETTFALVNAKVACRIHYLI